jgi:hypothetical protein
MEARFSDEGFAKKAYGTVVRRIIDMGVRPILGYLSALPRLD